MQLLMMNVERAVAVCILIKYYMEKILPAERV